MGQLFETGWKRKPRGADGKILSEPVKKDEAQVVQHVTVAPVEEVKSAD
jgi:mannosyl-oligosaccharide alpha-1,2-mannosidase